MAGHLADILEKMKSKNKVDLLLIHGAWSSKNAFNYLQEKLKKHKAIGDVYHLEYDINCTDFDSIIRNGNQLIDSATREVVVIGHSLGGLFALNLHDHDKVRAIVTVASPLSGIPINRFVGMLLTYRSPCLSNIFHMSDFINDTHGKEYTKPIHCVVTTQGFNPAWYEKSDGVVTVNSQKRWTPKTAKIHMVPYNHHEVLQTDDFVDIVESEINTCL